jgi:hypothetical protein
MRVIFCCRSGDVLQSLIGGNPSGGHRRASAWFLIRLPLLSINPLPIRRLESRFAPRFGSDGYRRSKVLLDYRFTAEMPFSTKRLKFRK